eukprot:1161125-Pelagomonas_calceolata.AAC.7
MGFLESFTAACVDGGVLLHLQRRKLEEKNECSYLTSRARSARLVLCLLIYALHSCFITKRGLPLGSTPIEDLFPKQKAAWTKHMCTVQVPGEVRRVRGGKGVPSKVHKWLFGLMPLPLHPGSRPGYLCINSSVAVALALVRLQRGSMMFVVSRSNNIVPSTRPRKTILRAKVCCGQGTKLL